MQKKDKLRILVKRYVREALDEYLDENLERRLSESLAKRERIRAKKRSSRSALDELFEEEILERKRKGQRGRVSPETRRSARKTIAETEGLYPEDELYADDLYDPYVDPYDDRPRMSEAAHRSTRSAARRVSGKVREALATSGESRRSLFERAREQAGEIASEDVLDARMRRPARETHSSPSSQSNSFGGVGAQEQARAQAQRRQAEQDRKNAEARRIAEQKFAGNPQMQSLIENVLGDDAPEFVLDEGAAGPSAPGTAPTNEEAFEAIFSQNAETWRRLANSNKRDPNVAQEVMGGHQSFPQPSPQAPFQPSPQPSPQANLHERLQAASRDGQSRVETNKVVEFDEGATPAPSFSLSSLPPIDPNLERKMQEQNEATRREQDARSGQGVSQNQSAQPQRLNESSESSSGKAVKHQDSPNPEDQEVSIEIPELS